MSRSNLPPLIVGLLRNPQTTTVALATDALEEFIWTRRAKGDTLFEVSVLLILLEDEVSAFGGFGYAVCSERNLGV